MKVCYTYVYVQSDQNGYNNDLGFFYTTATTYKISVSTIVTPKTYNIGSLFSQANNKSEKPFSDCRQLLKTFLKVFMTDTIHLYLTMAFTNTNGVES